MANDTIKNVKNEAKRILNLNHTNCMAHGIDHADRVMHMALQFADLSADKDVTALTAILHNVDDHKLFGKEHAENLSNASAIMDRCLIGKDVQERVLACIRTIGYSRRLAGITPSTPEAAAVSDADMCDAMGMSGIIRLTQYSMATGRPFFDRNIWPEEITTAEEYMTKGSLTAVNHIFEKILKLKKYMLTPAGKYEAYRRHDATVHFLQNFFAEQNVPEWEQYLKAYLKRQ